MIHNSAPTTSGRLFDQVSTHLRDTGSVGHHLMIAGGAALALMWQDRTTRDVDVLEHRFRAPTSPSDQRHTNAVDFISTARKSPSSPIA